MSFSECKYISNTISHRFLLWRGTFNLSRFRLPPLSRIASESLGFTWCQGEKVALEPLSQVSGCCSCSCPCDTSLLFRESFLLCQARPFFSSFLVLKAGSQHTRVLHLAEISATFSPPCVPSSVYSLRTSHFL